MGFQNLRQNSVSYTREIYDGAVKILKKVFISLSDTADSLRLRRVVPSKHSNTTDDTFEYETAEDDLTETFETNDPGSTEYHEVSDITEEDQTVAETECDEELETEYAEAVTETEYDDTAAADGCDICEDTMSHAEAYDCAPCCSGFFDFLPPMSDPVKHDRSTKVYESPADLQECEISESELEASNATEFELDIAECADMPETQIVDTVSDDAISYDVVEEAEEEPENVTAEVQHIINVTFGFDDPVCDNIVHECNSNEVVEEIYEGPAFEMVHRTINVTFDLGSDAMDDTDVVLDEDVLPEIADPAFDNISEGTVQDNDTATTETFVDVHDVTLDDVLPSTAVIAFESMDAEDPELGSEDPMAEEFEDDETGWEDHAVSVASVDQDAVDVIALPPVTGNGGIGFSFLSFGQESESMISFIWGDSEDADYSDPESSEVTSQHDGCVMVSPASSGKDLFL